MDSKIIFEQFLAAKKRQYYIISPIILLLVILMIWMQVEGGAPSLLTCIVIFGLVGASILNWRCPACHRYLGRQVNPQFCVHCGVELQKH